MLLIKKNSSIHTTIKYYENTTTKFHLYNRIFPISEDYKKISIKDLPKEFDILQLDSFEDFPLYILEKATLTRLELYCFFEMNDRNFQILFKLKNTDVHVIFHRNEKEYTHWFNEELRIKNIDEILKK